jgi:TIR domain
MLGLKLRRQDNRIPISYRAVDGTRIASQLDKYLSSLGYRVWLDEARDPIDNEPTILPGSEVQEEIRRALEVSNLLLLLDTPAAAESAGSSMKLIQPTPIYYRFSQFAFTLLVIGGKARNFVRSETCRDG